MNKTSIEWVKDPDGTQGYTWNPVTGCLNHTDGLCHGGGFPCYAHRLATTRLRKRYLANSNIAPVGEQSIETARSDPFYPRFWPERLEQPLSVAKPSGIFVCDMGELFGDWLPEQWQWSVFNFIQACPQHRFYLLTKQPQNLMNFSPFPRNCWVGVTMTKPANVPLEYLDEVDASVRYLSIEPMLAPWPQISFEQLPVDWVILGACTGTREEMETLCLRYPDLALMRYGNRWTAQPPPEWTNEIIKAADEAGVKVFCKNNLGPLLEDNLRQEMPGEG